SLRAAIAASTAGDTITTAVSGTITLMSNLPPALRRRLLRSTALTGTADGPRLFAGVIRPTALAVGALTGVVLAVASQPAGAANQVVTNTNDSGPGSLRAAIAASTAGDTITTAVSGTITLMSNLPPAMGQTIDLSGGNLVIAGPFGVPFITGNSSLTSPALNTYTGATQLSVPGANLAVIGAAGYSAAQSQLQVNAGTMFAANTTPTMGVAPGATFASLTGAGTINLGPGFGNGLDLTGNDQQSTMFSGNIIGTAGELALFGGGGSLTLTGTSNTYSGPTDIFGNVIVGTPAGPARGATLIAGAANVFSPNSQVVMLGGASSTLNLNNFNQTIGSLAGSGVVSLGSALLTLGGDNTSTTFTGSITGTGGIDKIGTGTFTLNQTGGANYSGPTLIDGGTLQAGASEVFATNSPVAIAPGARLDLNNFSQDIGGLSGAGSVTLGSGTLFTHDIPAATYSGVISGSGGLNVGSGTLTLSGANTYSGQTGIAAGSVLQAGAANAFSPNSAVLVTAAGTLDLNNFNQTIAGLSGSGSVKLGSATLTDNQSMATNFNGVISGTGGLTVNNANNRLILGGANTYSGVTTVNGALLAGADNVFSPNSAVTVNTGGLLSLNGTNQTIAGLSGFGSVPLGGGTLTVNIPSGFGQFVGVISGTGNLTKNGAGIQVLAGANTYSGATMINGGVLQAGADNAFSPNSVVSVGAGATLDLNGVNNTIAGLNGSGSVTLGFSPTAIGLTINPTVPSLFTGVISGGNGLNIGGSSTQTLTGVNTYTGSTVINSTLQLSGNGSIASSQGVIFNGSGKFDVSQIGGPITAVQAILSFFSTAANVNVGGKTLIFGSSTVQALNSNLPDFYLGSFTGNGGLVYAGTDTASLNGNSSGFTGT
ncbi:MAG: autotransporter-associated beta strand repeat-containing protein, partial [Alphaproteobacteria bacterium]|nr:autotransporter-associated beta strand repeat-containing protein [Alphaproteobacteria bacterium]